MTRMAPISLVALMLSLAPAWAGSLSDDADFVTRASTGNLFAITESRLALERSQDPRVKALAHRLAEDHEGAETALQAAADGSGITLATALDPNHQARVTALQSKSGADFDKAYIADQGALHSNALTLYGDCMLLSDNKKLKTLAIKMIPVTATQLNDIRALSGN